MKPIQKLLYALYFLLSFIAGYSQNEFDNFQFRGIKEGISNRGVWTMVQDSKGYIWIGTNGAGLYRYDGINYAVFESEWNNPKSINSNVIYILHTDLKNNLWVGTEEGLCLFDRNTNEFKNINLKQALKFSKNDIITVRSLLDIGDGNLLVGTEFHGLLKLNLQTLKTSLVKADVSPTKELFIRSLATNKEGKIFVGTDYGLKYYDPKKNSIHQLPISGKNHSKTTINTAIESLFVDQKNNLWIGTSEKGLVKVVKNKLDYQQQVLPITTKKILSIAAIDAKNIFCATENDGLFLLDNNGKMLKKFTPNKFEKNGLKSNSVWSLLKDKDNRMWVGFYNKGVSIFDKLTGQFNSIESSLNNINSLQTSSVTSIAKDSLGKFWISMDGGGVDVYDPKTKKIIHINTSDNSYISGLNNNNVQEVFIDSKGNIWLAVWNEGIFFLKRGTTKLRNYNSKNTRGISSDRVVTFAEDAKGNIWIGTFQKGLSYYDASKKEFFQCNSPAFREHGLHNSMIRKVIVDSDNIVWVGTIRGLYGFKKNGENFSVFSLKPKMSEVLDNIRTHTILTLYESKNKLIWIGTDGSGLFNYNKKTKKINWFYGKEAIKEKSVCSIIEDNNNAIWLGGRSGISKFDTKNHAFFNFNTEDGLLVNDFNINSVLKDEKGLIYFGNYEGINYFDPKQMSISNKEPLLYFSNFKIFNTTIEPKTKGSPLKKVISETQNITLNHNQSIFTIEYIGINYSYPAKNEYAYYLDGFEKDWNYVGNKRSATYTNLEPGNYIFKVKSSESGGKWNSKPLELSITILAPWWKTKIAYLFYLILIIVTGYFIINYSKNKFKIKQAINFEREKRIQNEKLNNKKLQFFTNISHEFRTPLTLIINPLEDLLKNNSYDLKQEVIQKLNVIHKSSDRLSRLINELMDFRKIQFNQIQLRIEKIEIIEFTKDIISYFNEEAALRKIDLSFSSSLKKLEDWIDPNMLEKIIFNILSNAFKVTPNYGSIKVRINECQKPIYFPSIDLNEEVKSYEISIEDSGSGIDKKDLKKIFDRFYQVNNQNKTYYGSTGIGLEVVKEFIELNKGIIQVDSVVGDGTIFRILFPMGNSFFKEDEFAKKESKTGLNIKNSFKPEEKHKSKTKKAEEESQINKTHTVLIVEDNADLRNYLKSELKKDYKVITANNGQKGYDLAVQKLPDLILTDVIMPKLDGLEMCKKIKSNIKTSHIPLLMLSAKESVKDRLEGVDSGADLYLSKPFEMAILKSSLGQLITSRQIIFNKFYDGITQKAQQKTTTIDNDFMQKILNYITENISEQELSVESLATIVFLSRSQLYRKIKTLTGVSVNEFIRNVRLEKAKQLIEQGNNNINEIGYKVGFSSPSYFTKCYKQKYGHLPTEDKK